MVNKIFIFFVAVIFLSSCNSKELSPEEYMAFIKSNKDNFTKCRKMELFEFDAAYQPAEFLALRESCDPDNKCSRVLFEKAVKNYDSAFYFVFKIKPIDNVPFKKLIKSKENLAEMNQYLMSRVKNDFFIQIGEKKIQCSVLNVESDLNIQNNISFVMSFEKLENQILDEDITLVYEDKMFQNGILKFNFKKEFINEAPKVKAI